MLDNYVNTDKLIDDLATVILDALDLWDDDDDEDTMVLVATDVLDNVLTVLGVDG